MSEKIKITYDPASMKKPTGALLSAIMCHFNDDIDAYNAVQPRNKMRFLYAKRWSDAMDMEKKQFQRELNGEENVNLHNLVRALAVIHPSFGADFNLEALHMAGYDILDARLYPDFRQYQTILLDDAVLGLDAEPYLDRVNELLSKTKSGKGISLLVKRR